MRPIIHLAGATLFLVLATANSGGYRFGPSDQAFYIPAILEQLDPARFPQDVALIGPQARYFFVDEIVAGAMRASGWSMEAWFAVGYVLTVLVLYAGLWQLGTVCFRAPYATWALLAAETLRHRIARTGVNTFEGYFHPRMLVFAVGVWAIGAYLRGRAAWAIGAVLVAGLLHPTTAGFFLVLLLPALWVTEPALRRALGVLATLAVIGAAWAFLAGPLATALEPMDAAWRSLLASKDYLFPASDWDLTTWLVNLGTASLTLGTLAYRITSGRAHPRETGLLAGAAVLTFGFLATLPAVTAGWPFFVQLQISRVFWILDLLATVAVVWWLVEGPRWQPLAARHRTRGAIVVAVVVAAAAGRGAWVMAVEHPERPLASVTLPDDDWTRVIEWARAQPIGVHLLAHPGHAWMYGTPLRYAGQDVFLEEVKDTAMAIYARTSAARVLERQAALGDYDTLDAERARELAAGYRLHYLVIDREIDLPLVHAIGAFRIYQLGTPRQRRP